MDACVTTYTCLAAAASVAVCTGLKAQREDYLHNRCGQHVAQTRAYQAFEEALIKWAEHKQQNPDSHSRRPLPSDFDSGDYVTEEIEPEKTHRPVTAGFGVATLGLSAAAYAASVFDRRKFAERADYIERWSWLDPRPLWRRHFAGVGRCKATNKAGVLLYCARAILIAIRAPRPARGWAVLSGAPGCFSGIYFWGYFGYIHGYHWSGGPPGGWGGPFLVNMY